MILIMVALAGWGLDQLVKALVIGRLDPERPVALLGGLVTLRLVFNSGAAFGMGQDYTIVFTVLSLCVLAAVAVFAVPRVRHVGWGVALGMLSAGVLGNVTDRIFRQPAPLHGWVVDFIQLPYFAIFNVADMFVTTAAVTIIVLAVFKNVSLGGERTIAVKGKSAAEDPAR